ncbi:MAG: ParB/RepB/Spo0J family partition protein [Bacilli bacterium]|nr:ParB/RepB/Spo0J family partition protein [Bacilli bacterium]
MKKDKEPILQNSSLSDLIEKFSQEDVIAVMEKEYQSAPAKLIPISLIEDTGFVREVLYPDDTISAFAEGLKEKGFYNPLVVRPIGEKYEVILGRKRFHGARKAGILSLPCVIVDVGDEEELLMLLADTRDNRDSNVVEMALVCDALAKKFGYSQKTLAELSHQSRSQITNILRILRLPKRVRNDICLGKLSYGHAKAIASLDNAALKVALRRIKDFNLSVRDTERYVQSLSGGAFFHDEDIIKKKTGAKSVIVKKRSCTLYFATEEEKDEFLRELQGADH